MSTTLSTLPGDTFERISRRVYGVETFGELIRKANPGVSEPLTTGTSLIIPDAPDTPSDQIQNAPSDNLDEVSLFIDGQLFSVWQEITITRSMDTIDVIDLNAPFQQDDPVFRETFKPLSFKPLQVNVGGQPLFTGTMVSVDPQLSVQQKTVTASGYGTPGVLGDCSPSANSFPIEFDEVDLRGITESLIAPFGLTAEFTSEPNTPFERVSPQPSQRILDFIINLAQQRGLLVASTETGKLLFQKEIEPEPPVARLEQGSSPLMTVSPVFDPQTYFSHVTGIEWVIVGIEGNQYTVENPRLKNVVRPTTFTINDTQGGDVQETVEAKIGRMLANVVSYSARVATWRDVNGELWKPNTLITLTAPGAMVYQEYTLLIRSVTFNVTATQRTATLELVLPGSFRGEIVEAFPWE